MIEYVAAGTACMMLFAVFIGFIRAALTRDQSKLVHHFALFILALSAAYVLRTVWWDTLRYVLGDNAWAFLRALTQGIRANIAFNLLAVFGAWHGLKALHLMIPEPDRPAWHWWTAWAYPPWGLIRALRSLRWRKRQ